jgi:predicted nucleic acid-binding protein
MRLFDASSIIEILSTERRGGVNLFKEGTRTDLTLFEVGNVVWKTRGQRGLKDPGEATRRVREAGKVLSIMDVAHLEPSEAEQVLGGVLSHGLSFYDASYLYIAIRDGMTLVTEDEALRKAAIKTGCPVERVAEIETQ